MLYETLTGSLPFQASDRLGWIHSHVARTPTPPSERVAEIPEAIDAIVLKLLAKHPDDRYQTAAGLAADLDCCLRQWGRVGGLATFSVGKQDLPERVRIPAKIYGRGRELAALEEALARVHRRGETGFAFISGYSGIGKSSLVDELRRTLVMSEGWFGAGKFDHFKRHVPYATLAEALQAVVRNLLGRPESELVGWRDELLAALGSNARLLTTSYRGVRRDRLRGSRSQRPVFGDRRMLVLHPQASAERLPRRLLRRMSVGSPCRTLALDDDRPSRIHRVPFLRRQPHIEALAFELAARACEGRQLGVAAQAYRSAAVAAYRRWGALAKVRELSRAVDDGAGIREIDPPVSELPASQQLDLETVVKASPARRRCVALSRR